MSKILVTGATGTIGQRVAEGLLDAGASLRIGARSPEKAAAYAARGAEVVTLDFDRPETLKPAMEGAPTVFLLTPFVEDFVPYIRAAIAAAKEVGVQHIVRLSVVGADPNGLGPGRMHGVADQLLKDSGIAHTLLLPTFFQDNFYNYSIGSIKAQSVFYGAAGDQRISYVSAQDIADVACKILLAPASHVGKGYVLTGEEALTENEAAAALTEILGREIRYVNLTPEQYAEGMRAQQMPAWIVKEMGELEQIKANGWAAGIAPDVAQILGRPARKLRDYLAENKARFL